MLVRHSRLFLNSRLLAWRNVEITALRIHGAVHGGLLLGSALLGEVCASEWLHGFRLLWRVFRLSFIDSVLVHNEHIVSISNRMLV